MNIKTSAQYYGNTPALFPVISLLHAIIDTIQLFMRCICSFVYEICFFNKTNFIQKLIYNVVRLKIFDSSI